MKTSLKRIIAMVLCLVMTITMLPMDMFTVSTASAADAENIIRNPGFESTWVSDDWKAAKYGVYSIDTSVKHEGAASMKMTADANNLANVTQEIAVTAGKVYDVSVYFLADTASASPFLHTGWIVNGSRTGSTTVKATGAVTEWTEFKTTLRAPEGATGMYIELNNRIADATVWVDSVSVAESENLVSNPGFESGWPNDWTNVKYGTYTIDTTKAHEGFYSVKMKPDRYNTGWIANVRHYANVEGGKSYDLSAFYIADKDTARPFFNLMWYKDDQMLSDAMTQIYASSASTTEWTELSGSLKAPKDANRLYIEFNIRNVNANVWVDSFSLVEGDLSKVNIITNPGLEADLAYWFPYSSEGGSSVLDSTVAHSGSKSIKIAFTSKGRGYMQQKNIMSDANTPYRLIAWYKTDGNIDADPTVIFRWNQTSGQTQMVLTGDRNNTEWKRLVWETAAPADVISGVVYPNISATKGAAWFDDFSLCWIDAPAETGAPHDFIDGDMEKAEAESPWTLETKEKSSVAEFTNSASSGSQAVRLSTTTEKGVAQAVQKNVVITKTLSYRFSFDYKTENVEGYPFAKIMWYDEDGNFISSDFKDLEPASSWTEAYVDGNSPANAYKAAVVIGMAEGAGTIYADNTAFNSMLLNVDYEPIFVSNVVNINESFFEPQDNNPDNDDPQKFWDMIPATPLNEPDQVLWTEPYFNKLFFGYTDGMPGGARIVLPKATKDRDDTIPWLSGLLGTSSKYGPALAVAADIDFHPFVLDHGTYTDLYYPRTEAHYLRNDYVPSYVISGDEYFKERGTELVNYLEFTQWHADGTNDFVEKYYSSDPTAVNAYSIHPEWRGGFDHCWDWPWLDGYQYRWSYHEPDHHVNSLQTSELIQAYEVFGLSDEVVEMCREFVYYQIPRYGFHKGEWNGHTYYWSEYNPTGESVGNNVKDACDNVNALVAEAVARVAYYEKDPVMKARFMEYAKGLVWYLVREAISDGGKWYYDGAENPMSQRKSYSHDNACMYQSANALAYLYKAGADVSDFLPYFEEINQWYNLNCGIYQRKRFLQVAKVYDGVPEYGNTLKFTTFVLPTTNDLEDVRFYDTIPEYGFDMPVTLDVRFSHVLRPTATNSNWTVDPAQDVVYTVTPEQMAAGINFPFDLIYGENYTVSYELNVINDPRFNREDILTTPASEVVTWFVDENNEAMYVKTTSETTMLGANGGTEPLNTQTTVDSTNFLSYGAFLHFRFEEEMNSQYIPGPAPLAEPYFDEDRWVNLNASAYHYPVNSLHADVVQYNGGGNTETYKDRGMMVRFTAVGNSRTWEFPVPVADTKFDIYASYIFCNYRGIIQMNVDGIDVGEPVDQYVDQYDTTLAPLVKLRMGTMDLAKGEHQVKYTTIGRNKNSQGVEMGLYDVITLRPVGVATEESVVIPDQFVIAEHDRVMRSTKTKLRLDTYVSSDNPYALSNITWVSSNPEVATVDERGYVTAVANGKTTISAITSDGSFADSINITVNLKEEEAKPGFSDVTSFGQHFVDVDSTNRYFNDIAYVSSTGLMNGTGNNKFSPDATITRGMIVTILYRLAGQPSFAQGTKFSDVADNAWYASAAKWGSANGIVEGFPNGTFKPNDAITREQLAAIMYRYAVNCGLATKGTANANLNGYADASSVSEYARVALNWALTNGVMETYANGAIAPKTNASRGEVARVFHNIGTLLDR